jgi:MFS family permease
VANRQEIAAVYAGAVIQGVALVTFPAVSAIFTSASHYGLSTTAYGGLFVPQAITAIAASLLGGGLAHRLGGKRVLLTGLAADLLAMGLLFASQFALPDRGLAYGLLLAATALLGVGFGFTVPALNTFTAAFFPAGIATAILTLNALLGLGTALAPVFASIFVGCGIWWGLPLLMTGLSLALLLFSWRLPWTDARQPAAAAGTGAGGIPRQFWIYAAFALLYGVCETMNGNWATVYMSSGLHASVTLSSLALTVFWASVTGGRILFAVTGKWLAERWTYRLLPLLLAGAFLLTSAIPATHPVLALASFGLAGIGCSALLPLVISFGQSELTQIPAFVAGGLIGFYQMGYGVAAFGAGPLLNAKTGNPASIFGWTSVCALILAGLAFAITGAQPRVNARRD